MTTKQIADAAGVSVDTVQRKIKEMYPEFVEKRKTTRLPQNAAVSVMSEIRKLNFVEPLPQNAEVNSNRIDRLESMVEKLCLAVASIPQAIISANKSSQKQIEYIQDYFGIIAYANTKGIKPTLTEAQSWGKQAAKISRDRNIEIRQIPDERWGIVRSYRIDVLETVFEI